MNKVFLTATNTKGMDWGEEEVELKTTMDMKLPVLSFPSRKWVVSEIAVETLRSYIPLTLLVVPS